MLSLPVDSSKSYPIAPLKASPRPASLHHRRQRELVHGNLCSTNNLYEYFLVTTSWFIRANRYCFIPAFSPKSLEKDSIWALLSPSAIFCPLLAFKAENSNSLVIPGILWFGES